MIITGESGVRKSYLARLIYEYAKAKGVITAKAQLISLNCADYANNPELLSSVLFGFKKRTFTGANDLAADQSIYRYYQKLISLRHKEKILKESSYELLLKVDEAIFAYLRKDQARQW